MNEDIPQFPERIVFPDEEIKILLLWKQIDAFKTSLKKSKHKPLFSLYEGPPFATGLPHYGHILTSTVKDIVARYVHQQGFHVDRRFGWDCHGLPVEIEVDKIFNIKSVEDAENVGIKLYNSHCRKIVTKYAREWEWTMKRIGRWVDFDNDYKTMYPWYMESVWWVFKQLYLKGLVYYGHKVMPFSTVCKCPLSNFEAGLNYKTVIDLVVVVSLPLVDDAHERVLLIWTTTPWTLPTNLAVCVNPTFEYATVKSKESNKSYILLKSRVQNVFKPNSYEVMEILTGIQLQGLRYKPIFSYYEHLTANGAFRVFVDNYVSDFGTGIVHLAPYFGEDDFRVCLKEGIITVDQEPICPLDDNGCFLKPVTDFEGQYFKEANTNIVEALKNAERLLHSYEIQHNYPFCWRSDTPLIHKSVSSWFIRVQRWYNFLEKCNSDTHWVPQFVKDKRFNNWLKDARDWSISRNRFWGTPIPIWTNNVEICCIGSIAELEQLTGSKIQDLHRENIDHLIIPSKVPGMSGLRRVSEVFDCWFESGAMPYAQQHFPFQNIEKFYKMFPVNIVAEGIDQTRGWFYTLLVISAALFGRAPFQNVIATGLVLASDGQKMSKRKNNYPDPLQLVSKYGADALRLYLINSPVVRAENLLFKEEGVEDMIKTVLMPWFHSTRFLLRYIRVFAKQTNKNFVFNKNLLRTNNIMDRWILSLSESLLQNVNKEMSSYHLYNIIQLVVKYLENLTNSYVRMNRTRLKGDATEDDQEQTLLTLFSVLFDLTKIMAPLTPFFSEFVFQYLKDFSTENSKSVHFIMRSNVETAIISADLEMSVSCMQLIIEMGRSLRDKKNIPLKCPLPEMVVIVKDDVISNLKLLHTYISSEMNVRNLILSKDREKYGISLKAKPDYRVLGKAFKSDYKDICKTIESLEEHEINKLNKVGVYIKDGFTVENSFVITTYKAVALSKQYVLEARHNIIVLLDVCPTSTMIEESSAREIINRVQRLRKTCHLQPLDEIEVYYTATKQFRTITENYKKFIENAIKTSFLSTENCTISDGTVAVDNQRSQDSMLQIIIRNADNKILPARKWINVIFGSMKGTVLLETTTKLTCLRQLKSDIQGVFNIIEDISLWTLNGKLDSDDQISDISGETILVLGVNEKNTLLVQQARPFSKFYNFTERGVCGTIIMENPVGVVTVPKKEYNSVIMKWITENTKK